MKMAEQVSTADSRAMQIQMMVAVLWRSGAVQHKHTDTLASAGFWVSVTSSTCNKLSRLKICLASYGNSVWTNYIVRNH